MPTRLASRLPISVKLPVVMGTLMLAVLTATTTVGLLDVRGVILSAAGQRLSSVSRQIATMLETSTRALASSADSLATGPALRAYLQSPTVATRGPAIRALEHLGRQPQLVVATELWNADATPLLQSGGFARLPQVDRQAVARVAATTGHATVGSFVLMNDSFLLPVIAPVAAGPQPLGYYVMWRRLGGSSAGRQAMVGLVGEESSILLGSTTGGPWTDLEKTVAPPPALRPGATVAQYQRGDSTRLGSAASVAGAPWLVVAEFPRSVVMRPMWALLRRRALIATAAVVLAMLVAWIASQYLVRPLRQLTERAEAMTEAGYATRIGIDRHDELGRLARAFDHAAERVREDQQRLENRVRERTVELHEALEQLRSAQDMLLRKERLAILGQLSSGVGHELRNPLGVMTNAVYYLDAVAGGTSPKVKEYLGILRTQIALSERIVGDLLDFARVKQPQRQSVSLAELADAQLGRAGDLTGVRVQKEFPAGLPRAYVDPMQVGQVVLNLLVNAVQAMGTDGGELRLRGSANGDGRLRLEVQDTGPGIDPALIEKIFEPLYTTKARGIGLGLAVSRSLAANNGAQLTAVSTPGQGATFVLSLPIASPGVGA